MKKTHIFAVFYLICFFFLCCNSVLLSQTAQKNSELSDDELLKAGTKIENINKQFSKDFMNGDSLALASHYAKDGQFVNAKGKDIISTWGALIRSYAKKNSKTLVFHTIFLNGDSQYLVEYGSYENIDDNKNVLRSGKYVVVWKMESGEWKIYRDWGL